MERLLAGDNSLEWWWVRGLEVELEARPVSITLHLHRLLLLRIWRVEFGLLIERNLMLRAELYWGGT